MDHPDSARDACTYAADLVRHGLPENEAIEYALASSPAAPAAKSLARRLWPLQCARRAGTVADVKDDDTPPKGGQQALPEHLRRTKRVFVMATEGDIERFDAWWGDRGFTSRSTAVLELMRKAYEADGY